MSRGKKFVALSLLTFIVLIVARGHVGPSQSGRPDRAGVQRARQLSATTATDVPVSQAGINELASQAGHLGVSINFTWMLITGFLVLFMQVGFAFLVTGLTRAKNAAHMMMMNIAAFAVALLAYYAVGFAFQFGGIAPIANLGGTTPLTGIFGHGSAGVIGTARLLAAEPRHLRRRRDGAVPVPGRVHGDGRLHHHRRDRGADLVRRASSSPRSRWARSSTRSTACGCGAAAGWRTSARRCTSATARSTSPDRGSCTATGGWAALALAMVLGPRIGKFNKDGSAERDPRPQHPATS